MRCAIYVRKSNDDNFKDKENKSVARQVEQAKNYILKKGWQVLEDHIYTDDDISGAEFQNRPSFHRLLNNLKEFDCLVMSESARFGRDMIRTAYYLSDILDSDTKIFYYMTDEEEKADTPERKLMITVKSYASEVERQKASQRARDALERKARKGYNTGGRVFGYDNVQVFSNQVDEKGKPFKSYTDYKINEVEAKVVNGMFGMYSDGYGSTIITKTLNGEDCYKELNLKYFDGKKHEPPRKGTGSWAPAGILSMLCRERYKGIVPFGKFRKKYKRGTQVRIKQKNYLKANRPDLRIVNEELWNRVQKRLEAVREVYISSNNGNPQGRPATGLISKYLLSGIGKCDICGGSMTVQSGSYGSPGNRWRVPLYHCSYHYKRGNNICSNKILQKVEIIDDQFLSEIEKTILTADNISYLYRKAIEEITKKLKEKIQNKRNPLKELQKEREHVKKELKNFENLIAKGQANDTILEWIDKRNQRLKSIEREIRELELLPEIYQLDLKRIDKELPKLVEGKIEDFKGLIKRNIPTARQAIKRLIDDRVLFMPDYSQGKPSYRLKTRLKTQEILDTNNFCSINVPRGSRTPVAAVKGRCPGPLDDGDSNLSLRVDCLLLNKPNVATKKW